MGHATPWNPSATGSAPMSSCRSAASRQNVSVCRGNSECLDQLCGTLGPELSPGWDSRSAAQANAWASAVVVPVAQAQAAATAGEGRSSGGIHDRPVDSAADCQADREAFRDSLPPGPCVAGDDESGMDVPEAGTPGHAERRGSHRPLENIRVATYKKKPEDLGPISYSSTKAGSSSSLTSARPGPRSGIRRSSGTATSEIESLPSPLSLFPHRASGLDFTSVFTAPTSRGWRSLDSCATFSGICADPLCSSGMVAPSTGASSSRSFCANTSDSMCIGSRPMPQSSTRTSSCGRKPKAPWPTVRPRTSRNLGAGFAARSIASEIPSAFFGLAFTLLTYRGHDDGYIHYLCDSQ